MFVPAKPTQLASLSDAEWAAYYQYSKERELLDSLKGVLPILDAVRLSTGLGRTQLERIEAARKVVAMAEGR